MKDIVNINSNGKNVKIVRDGNGFTFHTKDMTGKKLRQIITNNYDEICCNFADIPKTAKDFFKDKLIINNLKFNIMTEEAKKVGRRFTDKSLLESKDVHEKLAGFISMAGKTLKDDKDYKEKAIRDKRSRIVKFLIKEKPDVTDMVKELKGNQALYTAVMIDKKGTKEVKDFFEKASARFGSKVTEITLPKKVSEFWG